MIGKENFMKFSIISIVILLAGLFSVNIVTAGQNRCFPEWSADSPILIDKDIGRIEFAPGDTFSGEANYKYSSNCRDYVAAVLTWQALKNNVVTNDIIFSDSHAKKTMAMVDNGAQTGGVVTIRAILTFADDPNGVRSEKEINVFTVSKPPAPKIVLSYGPVKSLVQFEVGFEDSEAYGSSNNFIRNCSLVLRDEQGSNIDTDEVKTVFQKPMPVAKLKTNKPGIHTISASCSDSHGTIGKITETIPIDISDSKQNTPFLIVNKTINCKLGDCVADFSRTNAFGKELKVEYIDVTNANIRNPLAVKCGNEVCRLNLTRPGVYKIKLVAKFLLNSDANGFYYSDKSEETIQVYVSQQTQAQQTAVQATVQPAAIYRQPVAPATTVVSPISDDGCEGYRCKSSPGAGGFAPIAILAILARKIKK